VHCKFKELCKGSDGGVLDRCKRRGISWPAERLTASQGRFLLNYFVKLYVLISGKMSELSSSR
jgi:hypothetical protein